MEQERLARCGMCGTERPSSPDLPFFEFLGEGSLEAQESCGHCGYSRVAHDPTHMETLVHDRRTGRRRPTVEEDGRCPGFEPRGARATDRYYCGCRGWD